MQNPMSPTFAHSVACPPRRVAERDVSRVFTAAKRSSTPERAARKRLDRRDHPALLLGEERAEIDEQWTQAEDVGCDHHAERRLGGRPDQLGRRARRQFDAHVVESPMVGETVGQE